jgi:hypothetical protein
MNDFAPHSAPLAPHRASSATIAAECASDAALAAPARLHGNSAPRCAARNLRAALIAHCGGRPSATQAAMIEQAAELKLRIAVMDQDFIRTGRRSAHASRDYLAWSNSLVRLLRQLGLKGQDERAPSLSDYLAAAARRARTAPDAGNGVQHPAAAKPASEAQEAATAAAD